jgi:hypothetical protein
MATLLFKSMMHWKDGAQRGGYWTAIHHEAGVRQFKVQGRLHPGVGKGGLLALASFSIQL